MTTNALKKSALLLGLFTPLVYAQSQVSIYGTVDEYIGSVRTATPTTPAASSGVVNSGGMTTSYIGFRGTEDLGGDLKAIFNLESFLRTDVGTYGRNDAALLTETAHVCA